MARYTNEDQQKLEELLTEGWFDRMKTRGAQALGAAKGLGQELKGGLGQAAGSAVKQAGNYMQNDALVKKGEGLVQKGVDDVNKGGTSGHNAKVEYLKKNISKRIDKFVADLNNDMQRLGLNPGEIKFVSDIENALDQLKMDVSSGATPPPLPQSNATPPPLPNNDDDEVVETNDAGEDDDDWVNGYALARQQRSERSKAAAAKRKAAAAKSAPNPKKGKSRDITKTYSKDFVRENYDKLIWGE